MKHLFNNYFYHVFLFMISDYLLCFSWVSIFPWFFQSALSNDSFTIMQVFVVNLQWLCESKLRLFSSLFYKLLSGSDRRLVTDFPKQPPICLNYSILHICLNYSILPIVFRGSCNENSFYQLYLGVMRIFTWGLTALWFCLSIEIWWHNIRWDRYF